MNENQKRLVLEEYEVDFKNIKFRSSLNISFNRIAFIIFIFFVFTIIFSIKIIYLGSQKDKKSKVQPYKSDFRSSILDRNGNILSQSVITTNIGINPNLIIDKKKLLINLKIIFPNKNFEDISSKIEKDKFFYLEKKISPKKYNQLFLLGDKSIIEEQKISRIYPQSELFSHIIGQIDDNNKGVSGIEKSFNHELISSKEPLKLTVDMNLQYLIRQELVNFTDIFKNIGSTAILMNINSGEILSMVSLPDFDLNIRKDLSNKIYLNRATKGVYELGSVFKTFTLASALNVGAIEIDTKFSNLKKAIRCGNHTIREYDEKIPNNLTAEQILIRSGNIGSVRIAQKVGIDKHSMFLKKIGILNKIDFDLEEVGQPIPFNWGKCKLATVSFGHGITTTPLQLAKGYAIISNGGYDVTPTLIKQSKKKKKKKILEKGVSKKVNSALRKIVSTKEGTAELANILGYEVAGKTGTAQQVIGDGYSKVKINTFASIFPSTNPKFVLVVLLEDPKISKDYVYKFRNSNFSLKGTPFNTAGWTTVEIAGKIIEKIGPILATKY
tara:strand:- start:47 stop:1708 length:1662 start_codon:yes stop_codon:yes gene_type:complete